MNNNSYIQELTNAQLLEHIRDFSDKPRHQQELFDYDLHLEELSRRAKDGKMFTRFDILRALNECDHSTDFIDDSYYVVKSTELFRSLGLA